MSSSSPSGQSGKKRKNRKGKAPFSSSSGGSGRSGGKGKGAGKKSTSREDSPCEGRGLPGSALETVAGNRSRILGSDHSPGRLPCSLPGLSSSPFSHPGIVSDVLGRLSSGSCLAQEVEAMLAKGALEIARDLGPGFYSRLFLVEKASGSWRPVIDLSHLNEFVQLTPFKMETVTSILLSVREGDFLVSLDLKDAYFQITIHPSSRKLLRFTSEGTVYQFRALCFRLSTAPQVFTRVFAAVSAWTHSHGIRLLRYLDNWLVLSSSEREAKQAVQSLLSICRTLRTVINEVTASRLGQPVNRPLCDEPQRETAPVLLVGPGSPGRLRGCVSSSLGRPGSVRVPSLSSGWSGDPPCPRVVAGCDDSGRTPLAREGVVRRPSSSADPTTSHPALVGQSASAAPLQPLPPRRPRAEPSRVATLKRHFRKSGFSGRAA